MRFLIDECTGKRLANLLEKEGHDVLFADDKDFGELVFRLGKPIKGVILLRIITIPEIRLKTILNLLKNYDVKNKFLVLQENAVRIRKI